MNMLGFRYRTARIVHLLLLLAIIAGCGGSDSSMPLPENASEDVSHLLVVPEAADEHDFDAPRDYLPDEIIEWVATIELVEVCEGAEVKEALDYDWQSSHGRPTIFGFSPETGQWSFVFAADSPDSFSRLKIAWSLWDAINECPKETTAHQLETYLEDVEKRLTGLSAKISLDSSAKETLNSVSEIAGVVAKCNQDVTLWLRASDVKHFNGRELWDAMLCLGIDYGDGDLFHWINSSGFGSDHFFTVQTSTPPGYFIPQRIASGDGDVEDLMFNYSIPRSPDPVAVFDSMVDAIKYLQKRLGGEVVTGTGKPFDQKAERARVESIVQSLRRAGFVPGTSITCRVF